MLHQAYTLKPYFMRICKLLLFVLLCFGSTSKTFAQESKPEVDKNKVAAYFQNEQYSEAIEYLQSKQPFSGKDLNSINDLGYAYFMTENYEMSQRNYDSVLAIDSLNFTANRYADLISKADREYRTELFYNLRLLRIQPLNAGLNKIAADTYQHLKSPDTALLFYARAYILQPANTKIASAYVDALLDKELYATADSVTVAFLAKDSLNSRLLKLAITSYTNQKKPVQAAKLTWRWLLTGEIDPKVSVNLAMANYYTKDYTESYNVCNVLLQQGIETESLFYYASQAKHKLNEYRESNELLKKCLDLAISKNTNLYYFSTADNLEALSQYQGAIAAYDTAFFLFRDPLALYNIGRLYEYSLNNVNQAHTYYRKYLRIAKPVTKDEQRVYAYVKQALAVKRKTSSDTAATFR
jgi:tetratricopeptide (TPR) repeat protein